MSRDGNRDRGKPLRDPTGLIEIDTVFSTKKWFLHKKRTQLCGCLHLYSIRLVQYRL